MRVRAWFANGSHVWLLSTLALPLITLNASAQPAQTPDGLPGPRQIVVYNNEEAPLGAPSKKPGPLTLEQCLDLGFNHQPSLDAARASLDAAAIGASGIGRLNRPFARLIRRDLPIRAQQSNIGVAIAESNVTQTEQETRYAIMRNFFSVQYARSQEVVIDDVLRRLTEGRKRANELYLKGDPMIKITKLDINAMDVQIKMIQAKKSSAVNGVKRATAAMREAMGLLPDYPLEVAAVPLPPAVYVIKVNQKDDEGKLRPVDEYHQLYKIDRDAMIAAGLSNRPEINQANLAACLVALEISAQGRSRGVQAQTFAMGADLHAKPIPTAIHNGEYRPGAITIEMPPQMVGRKNDRMARAGAFHNRAIAVVDKTTLLIALDVEAQYLKWAEAADQVEYLKSVDEMAQKLVDDVLKLAPTEFTSNNVIQANFTAIMVRTQLNEAMHNHALALAGLERATAGAFRVFPIPAAPATLPK